MNVLIAAFRRDHPNHSIARTWLDRARVSCAEGSASLTLLPMVMVGFLRLVTNPLVFVDPDSTADAVTFVDALLSSPGVELVAIAAEWPLLRQKLLTTALQGNDIPDAWIAAASEAAGEHLVTFDRDFRRLLPSRDVTVLEVK